jgi:hypothetical protein
MTRPFSSHILMEAGSVYLLGMIDDWPRWVTLSRYDSIPFSILKTLQVVPPLMFRVCVPWPLIGCRGPAGIRRHRIWCRSVRLLLHWAIDIAEIWFHGHV